MHIWLQNPSCRWQQSLLTEENDDAGQDGDERPRAQTSIQDVGLGIAGQQGTVHVTPTDLDGEGVGAAHGRDSAIADYNGQEVQILLLPTEASTPGIHPCGAICWGKGDRWNHSVNICAVSLADVRVNFSSSGSTARILNLGVCRSPSHLALQNNVSIFWIQAQKLALFLWDRYRCPHTGKLNTLFSDWVLPFIRYHKKVWAWTTYSM